jgi:hypothetical protein
MPIQLDDVPTFATASEESVHGLLLATLGEDDLLGAGVRITQDGHDREIDLLVGLAGGGVLTVEVKGGPVWREGTAWRQSRRGRPVTIDPVAQAREAKYALRGYVSRDARWGRRRIRWGHAVVLAHTAVDEGFATPDCPREHIFGRDDLDGLAAGLRRIVEEVTDQPPATAADLVDLRAILAGRFPPQADLLAAARERDDVAERLTEQQAVVLDAARLLDRVEVRGGAGSGKTWLAVEQARRLAASGQRVALLCYSRGLAAFLQRRVAAFPNRRHRPAYVGTFHGLGEQWGARLPPSDDDSQAWEVELPRTMQELAAALPEGRRLDAIVVDEAQDFSDSWWPALLGALREEDSGVYVFSDESQRVFARYGGPPLSLVPLMLDVNLRNTRQIGTVFRDLAPFAMRLRGGDGPEVRFVECAAGEALERADDEVDDLLDAWRPADLALLCTGSRHPEQVARQARGQDHYWASFWDEDQVFYGHVLGFKGLERRVVVLALNEAEPGERSRERLYVGLSRARDQLVVCGDPDFVAEVGGPELLHRLRAGQAPPAR